MSYSVNTDRKLIRGAIARGIDYLKSVQLMSGELPSYHSTAKAMETARLDSTVFPTVVAASAISTIEGFEIEDLLGKIDLFLVNDQCGPGIWKYWTKDHPYRNTLPPDLDDIACISTYLRARSVSFPDNEHLFQANRSQYGLYYTWLLSRKISIGKSSDRQLLLDGTRNLLRRLLFFWKTEAHPMDIDVTVNANVLNYLGDCDQTQIAAAFIRKTIEENSEHEHDKWYLYPYYLFYIIAKLRQGGDLRFDGMEPTISRRIDKVRRPYGRIGENVLHTALTASTIMNLGTGHNNLNRAIHYILSQQREDGAWDKFYFYYGGPKSNGDGWYSGWGGEALTTSLCCEALYKYCLLIPSSS